MCVKEDSLSGRKFGRVLGNEYGKWVVIDDLIYWKPGDKRFVLCECNCKERSIRLVGLTDLKNGKSHSCGCYNIEKIKERMTTHGYCYHPLYNIWTLMKKRCYNENDEYYYVYGGRGIKVCDEWLHNPEIFIEWALDNGWSKGLQIDRENNDGNYEPSNCRFATNQINVLNMRLIQGNNTSGYRGAYYHKGKKTFVAQIGYNKKYVLNQPGFKTAKDAAIARDIFIIKNNLPHKLNFPELAFSWCL